jgi:hypothetical protein
MLCPTTDRRFVPKAEFVIGRVGIGDDRIANTLHSWFSFFDFDPGFYISFTDGSLLAILQVLFYLFFVLLGSIGVKNTLAGD